MGDQASARIVLAGGAISLAETLTDYKAQIDEFQKKYVQIDVYAQMNNPSARMFEVKVWSYDYIHEKMTPYVPGRTDPLVTYLRVGR